MRRFFITLTFVTGYAFTAFGQSCVTSPERQAFNTIALKSYLMVAALSCNAAPEYNQFMIVFQPFITGEQHVLDVYFQRAGGQAQEDGYVTQLANSQSQASELDARDYCGQVANLYGAVLNLNSANDLAGFLSVNPPPQPISMDGCLPGAPPVIPAPKLQTAADAVPAPAVHYAQGPDSFSAKVQAQAKVQARTHALPAVPIAVPPQRVADAGPISPDTAAAVASVASKSQLRASPLSPPPGTQSAAFERQPKAGLAMNEKSHHVQRAAAKKTKPKPNPLMQTEMI